MDVSAELERHWLRRILAGQASDRSDGPPLPSAAGEPLAADPEDASGAASSTSIRNPTPRTVMMIRGEDGSISSLDRRR